MAEQDAGKNEHLRAFLVTYPAQKETEEKLGQFRDGLAAKDRLREEEDAKIRPMSRNSLFSPSTATKKETYQRVLRLSPIHREVKRSRLGAVATGLAPQGEIVIFNASFSSAASEVRGRIKLEKGQEAADVDIANVDEETYHLAYCTDYELSLCKITNQITSKERASMSDPRLLYATPSSDSPSSQKPRSIFRALRFLSPDTLVLLSNKPRRSGVELLVLRFGEGLGKVVMRKSLHQSMKAAVGLETASLSLGEEETKQMVVAVAGQDISVELLTLECSPSKGVTNLRHYATLRSIHPLQVTQISLSSLVPADKSTTGAPCLKLASVSMGNTVAVHTLSVTQAKTRSGSVRYALAASSQMSQTALFLISLVVAVLVAILARFFSSRS